MSPCRAGALAIALPCLLIAQPAILQVRVVEGEGAVYALGSRNPRPLTVEVTDETGRPVPGAAVSFQFPEEGPSGLFANGLRTELVITASDGRASIRGFQLNRMPGPFEIRIIVSKGEARAGATARQYISDNPGARAPSTRSVVSSRTAPPSVRRPHSRWVAIGLIAAGSAGAGFAAVRLSSTAKSSKTAAALQPSLSIGAPVITIGRP